MRSVSLWSSRKDRNKVGEFGLVGAGFLSPEQSD